MYLLSDTRDCSLRGEGRPQRSHVGHLRILAATKRHDAEAAPDALRRHIEGIEEIVLAKF